MEVGLLEGAAQAQRHRAIRIHLQNGHEVRDLAMFKLAIDGNPLQLYEIGNGKARALRSDQCFDAFALKQIEQFLRWTTGVLVTHFPLAHSGRTGVEQ